MSTLLGTLRGLVLAPSLEEVTFARRGFPGARSPAAAHLEAIPQAVVCGFEWGIGARDQWEVERRLSLVDADLRGFAYEGATMAFTLLDVLPGRKVHRTRDLLLGPGQPHIFLSYIGIGFAMARLPRPLWARVLPNLDGVPYFPTMSWLCVDGYGFDLAYFNPRRWVDQQRVPDPYPWQGDADYFPRAVDQGIGRALWFIHGARVSDVAAAVRGFAVRRQPDLWSGVGLAATFAGGCDADALVGLRAEAGEHHGELAQGAVFAVYARHHAGVMPAHSKAAGAVLTGLSVADIAALAEVTVDEDYEIWRGRIRAHFTADVAKSSR